MKCGELLRADASRYTEHNPHLWTLLKLIFSSRGFLSVFFFRLSSAFRERGLGILAGLLDRFSTTLTGAEIRSTACIGPGLHIAHTYGLVIGGNVRAGRNLSLRQCTTLGGRGGRTREHSDDFRWSQPVIGDDVSIGCNAVLLGPILVGSKSVIGACSLVIHDVPSNTVVGGNPARPIGDMGVEESGIF